MNNDSCSKYIRENFYPTGIVFSTDKAKKIIGKNNLTPSEFLRPFGKFPKADFSLGTFSISIQNFRLDFYDSEKYMRPNPELCTQTIESVLSDQSIHPELPVYNLKDRKQNYKIPDNVTNKLNNLSFPWFNEYANTIAELNRFNEYELYQQPLCVIYFCSIDDPLNLIKPQLNDRDKIPPLLFERVYDSDMPIVIIILNDKSPDSVYISDAQKTQCIETFRQNFKNNYLLYWELNDINAETPQSQNDKSLNYYSGDIWSKYAHRTELWQNQTQNQNANQKEPNTKNKNLKGKLLNLSARKKFHQMIYDFFNKYVVKELEKKLTYIDRYITENKKGIKNTIFGFLKGDNQNQGRWNNHFRMYMLSSTEFQEYLIATIFFYFRNYEQAKEICGIFMEDIKKKSPRHYNAALELQKMCSLMSSSSSGKENSFEPFDQHVNNKDYMQACRALFFGIKASEQKLNLNKLPITLTQACRVLSSMGNYTDSKHLTSIIPIILEQTSIYYLMMNPMKKRKFFITIIQAAQKYLNEIKIKAFIKYAFCDFLFLKEFMDSNNDDSYLLTKEFLTDCMGNLSTKLMFFPGCLVFYQRYIESCIYYSNEQNEQRVNKIMDNLNKLFRAIINVEEGKKNGAILGEYDINDIIIPEIDNTSLLVIEEQDYSINSSDNMNFFANPANWSHFDKYDYVPVKKIFLCLTPPDIMALKNLDNIVLNKQNFSNFFSKRKFHINVKNKIYVRFLITNPLPFDLNITDMKLIIDFISEKKDSGSINEKISTITTQSETDLATPTVDPVENTNSNSNSNLNSPEYECENKKIKIPKFSSQKIELYLQVFKEGKINIKGVEFLLGGCALVKHLFNKKNKMKLYRYAKDRRKSSSMAHSSKRKLSTSSQNSTSSKGSSRNSYQPHINYKEDIICDIVDNCHDINIVFPLGKEIHLYKDQFFLMPIKIINNSEIKIKRFCFYFNDGIHNYGPSNTNKNNQNDDLNGCCYLNEVIYKEIEIDNDKTDGNNEKTIYVPLLPRKKGDIFLKILFKFEEDKTYIDNEVLRFLVKIKVKDSFNFLFKESINQFLPTMTQFQLNSICTIKNNCLLDNFSLSPHIYLNDTFEVHNNTNEWQKTINKDYIVLYNKFIFNKKIGAQDDDDNIDINNNDNEYVIKKKHEKLNKKIAELEKSVQFDENNYDGLLIDPQQSHIKKKLCNLLAKNNLIFNWSATEKKTQKEIKGFYIHNPNLKIPTINVKFLTQLLTSSITLKYSMNKIDNNNTVVTLIMTMNKNIFKEINDIRCFDVYINQNYSEKFNWIGLKKYSFQNNNTNSNNNEKNNNINNSESNEITLEFNCLFKEKGEYDLNQVGMIIYSNIPRQKEKYIQKILSPIIVKID